MLTIKRALWQAGGMGIDPAIQELLQQTTGLQPMQTATGMQAFCRSLALPYDQILVVEGIQHKIATYLQKAPIFKPSFDAEKAAPYQYANAGTKAAFSLDQLQQQLKLFLAAVLRIKTSISDVYQPFVG